LAEEIVSKDGLVITEYFRESQTPLEQSGRYVTRDRLQALFSDCVILSASYAKNDQGLDSGSRHAMAAAAKYGLMRGVLPDRSPFANNPKYDLNREIRSVDHSALEFSPPMLRDLNIPNRAILPEQPAFLF
jgi:DNA processing protein